MRCRRCGAIVQQQEIDICLRANLDRMYCLVCFDAGMSTLIEGIKAEAKQTVPANTNTSTNRETVENGYSNQATQDREWFGYEGWHE